MKVISEGSIGSNLRRIEAVTGMGTIDFARRTEQILTQVADEAGIPVPQVVAGVHRRLADLNNLQAENRQLQQRLEQSMIQELVTQADDGVLIAQVEVADVDMLRRLATQLARKAGLKAAVLATVTSAGKPAVAAAVGSQSGLDAGEILEPVSQAIGGGHGRQHDVAVAGGRDSGRLAAALNGVRMLLAESGGISSAPSS